MALCLWLLVSVHQVMCAAHPPHLDVIVFCIVAFGLIPSGRPSAGSIPGWIKGGLKIKVILTENSKPLHMCRYGAHNLLGGFKENKCNPPCTPDFQSSKFRLNPAHKFRDFSAIFRRRRRLSLAEFGGGLAATAIALLQGCTKRLFTGCVKMGE